MIMPTKTNSKSNSKTGPASKGKTSADEPVKGKEAPSTKTPIASTTKTQKKH
jgi:hypothetical protein